MDKDYYSYKLIQDDYQEVCQFIEARDENLDTFSHRVYELYLRVCTEFESICKNLLVDYSYPKALTNPNDLKIYDYEKIYSDTNYLGTSRLDKEVGLQFWQPNLKFIKPFEDWANGNTLTWYQDYNKVKHNRDSDFSKASFKNLTLSFSGLFLVLQASKGWSFFQPYSVTRSQGSNSQLGQTAEGCIFRVR